MALTPAEKQKQYRERQKLKAAGLIPEPAPLPKLNIPITGFSEWIRATDEISDSIGWVNNELGNINLGFILEGPIENNDLKYIEKTIESLSTSLETLTGLLSEFRRQQIEKEVEGIRQEELNDPLRQGRALNTIIRLKEVQKNLARKYRLTLSEYWLPAD